MNIAQNISDKMKEKKVTQVVLSESIGVSQAYISALVNGEKIPSLVAAKKIANCLGCTIDELVN